MVFGRAWRPRRGAFLAAPAPRREPLAKRARESQGRLASRPPGPQGGAREAAAKGLPLPRLARAAAPAPSFLADRRRFVRPSPRRQLRQAGPRPRSLSFSSTTAAGKRKRKRSRGGPRPSAVNAERGLEARGGGSGLRPARGRPGDVRAGTRSPGGRERARREHLRGTGPGTRPGSKLRGPQRAPVCAHGSRCRGPSGLLPRRPPQSVPASASELVAGLLAALRGFLASRDRSGLGGREQASEGCGGGGGGH